MKSMMKRTTLREIRQSLGRYLAIWAIVALGVGFFAGLKITKTVMVESADAYLQEKQLYDYRLLSTLGFEEEDVRTLAQKEDVRAVEGAVEADILYLDAAGNESVLKAHSLLEHINGVELTAGRMPENATECIVDSNVYNRSAIGSKLVLSDNNEQEDLDKFACREYTIVGVAQASAYIQFERGNTPLGNGSVSGFVYLLPEGFATDYYTEIYVKFDTDALIYSEEYNAYVDAREAAWKDYCKAQGMRRYQSIVDEAEAELADGEAELASKKAEAEKELADARSELAKAEEELADGEEELTDAEQTLAQNRARLDREARTLADSRTQLEEREAELAAMEQLYAGQAAAGMDVSAVLEQLATARLEIEAAKRQLAAGEERLAAARRQLSDAEAEIGANRQKLLDAREELAAGREEYNEANQEFEEEIASAEAEIADAREEIAKIEEPETYVLGRDTNIGYVCFESDSSIVEGIANVFPVFFFMVAALVCMTTMNRMVEEQRTQIGVLKALGYGEAQIMGKYLFYSGSAAVTGCVAGYFLGIHLFPLVIWMAYGIMYRMGGIVYVFDWASAVFCLAASLLCSMGTTWVSCRHEFKEAAANLMRPKAPRAGRRVFLEHVPFIWRRLKFLHKVSVRNIVRYKRRFFMMVIGISGCTALLVTGFGVKDSVTSIADRQFEEIQTYQLGVTLKSGVGAEEDSVEQELSELIASYGGEYTAVMETTMDMEAAGSVKSVNLIIAAHPDTLGAYIDLHTSGGEAIAYPAAGEAVICDKLAQRYRIRIGDTIRLYDENRRELRAVVTGICENYIYNYVYVNGETYENALDAPEYKNIYVNLPGDVDVHAAGAAIMKAENVTAVAVNRDMLARFSSMMSSMDYIVFVVIACAAALAFIVLYNLNNINITERIREIATIKVLGFFRNETASYVFRENIALTAIGCAVGLVLGKLLHIYVMHEVDIDMISFDVHVRAVSYLFSVLLTFLFTWVVNLMMAGKLDRINMAESLKSVD